MENKSFDIVVIGGGPGGYVAAIRAAQLGLKTAVVEANHMGGICLNWGCIPTKALLRSAEVLRTVQHAGEFGINVKGIEFDINKIVKRSRDVAAKLSGGISGLMKKNKIEVFDGFGKLNGKGKVKVEKDGKKIADIEAKHIILATGARARSLPGLESDGKQIVTYKEAMIPDSAPKSLLVVGSGAIGIEFASFYNALGVDVTVVELADRVLPVEDAEISKIAQKSFESQGFKIKTSTTVKEVKKNKDSIDVVLDTKGTETKIKVDRIITAVGIVPNTENIGLEGTKVKLDRGHIITDKYCETDEKGVYAIGDVAGAPWLAHKASHEGIICVEKIAGLHPHTLNKNNIPVKTIFDSKTGELLGAHLIGAEVTELINGFLVGKTMEATEADFMHTIFPHPTLSEMMHESVLDAFGRVVHM
ncbi:MAG: dihydrolipoyl dehydrogenase [Rickettsiaceae bacterium]|nr:dihydrolipoyl dehydrogenase [Rickettsiaceae bacterium]